MPREARAVLFDLDDTLYPQRRFALSGFAAVARHLAMRHGVPAAEAYRTLCAAYRRGADGRGRECQACLETFALPAALAPSLVEVIRAHRPRLRLPASSRAVLATLRPSWKLAVVTNGTPAIQAAKVDSLGLTALVDVVVYAAEHGSGRGKPDVEPFAAALARLGVRAANAVFVGDNEVCDIEGGAAAGLRTVRLSSRTGVVTSTSADAIVGRLDDVPAVAAALLAEECDRVA